MKVAIWLGSASPVRSVRWLDGALEAAAKFDDATAIAAGDATWLDLAADRATRLGLPSVGVPTDLQLDYLGWAQVAGPRGAGLDVTVERNAAVAPELCVQIGAPQLDVAGASAVVRIGATGKNVDAAVTGGPGSLVGELLQKLGRS